MHETYMKRCFELAEIGLGNVAPNPLVGSVIVYENKIIGEGFHQQFGEAHAEVNAIESVKDKSLLSLSTLYVNLEPCAHHGKTPPCANLIIDSGIKKVVISNVDPFEKVAGKGIALLEAAGIEVTIDVLKNEGLALNKRFFTFHQKKRPYVILKWAETADGFLDHYRTSDDDQLALKITNEASNVLVHKWRSEEMAIMIGRRTASLDDPSLTTRLWPGKSPLRLIIDPQLQVDSSSVIFEDGNVTWIYNALIEGNTENVTYQQISNPSDFEHEIMTHLYDNNIQSLIIEGGANTLNRFIEAGLWDEARIFTGTARIGEGVLAPSFKGVPNEVQFIETDKLAFYRAE